MRRPPLRALLLLSSLVASSGLFAAGCGASASKSSAPIAAEPAPQAPATSTADAEKAEEPATLEEAEVALSRAQSELDSALGPVAFAAPPAADQASGAAAPAPAAEPKAGAPAEERAPSPSKAQRQESESSRAEGARKKEASDCALACRAFQSLNRAVDAVCRLDSGGERCSRARRVAADAQARVASCSCQAP